MAKTSKKRRVNVKAKTSKDKSSQESLEALRNSEEKYRSLFANMMDGFAYHKVLFDATGNPVDYVFLEVNDAFERLTGLSKANVVGKRVTEVIPGIEKDPANWIGTYGKVATTGQSVKFESFAESLQKWYSVSAYSPEKGYFVATFEDITERKKTEDALMEQKNTLQGIMENAGVMLAYFDNDFNFLTVNSAYAKGSGHTVEELIGKNHFALFPNPENQAIFERVRDTGEPIAFFDKPFEFADQPERGITYWDWTLAPVKDQTGQVEGLVLSLIETTEHKKAEEEIRVLARYPAENPNPVMRLAKDGTIQYCNDAGLSILNEWRCQIGQLAPSSWRQLVADVFKSGTKKEFEEEYGTQTFSFVLAPIAEAGYVNIYARDITERKKAENELRRAQNELEARVEERTKELKEANEAVRTERQRLYDLLNTMPVMVCLLTKDYHVAFANQAFTGMFGESKGRHCYEYVFGRSKPCEFCEAYKVFETNAPHHWECKSPTGRNIDVFDYPFTDTDGTPLILEVDMDITERKKAEEAVKAERKRFIDILEMLPAYLVLLTPDYHVSYANRFFRERFGEDRGHRCFEYLFGRTEPCEPCETYKVLNTKSPLEWEWRGPDDRNYYIFDYPFTDIDGSTLIMEVGIDITERKNAEEALHKANELLREENQERRLTEQSLRLEETRLDALLRLSQISEASLGEITSFTLEQAVALTHSRIGFVGFLNEDETIYTLHTASKNVVKECNVVGNPMEWPISDAGLWANAIRERKTVFVNDYSAPHPHKKGLPPGHVPIERFMVVPFFEGERIVAVAGVGNKTSDYDKSDERQISLLLSGMWSCMQKNRSREELKKAHDELEKKVEQRTAELVASTVALQDSQKDLNRAQVVAKVGSWRLDVKRNDLVWSDETHRMFGIPKGTPMTYETFLDKVHPDDREHVDQKWQAALRGEPYDIDHRIVVNGEIKWVRENAELEIDKDGVLLGGFGTAQDITERKEAEEALQQAKDEWERTFDSVPDLIAILDKEHRIVLANRAMANRLGVTPEQCIGMNCYKCVHDTDSPPEFCPHARTLKDGKEHIAEVHEDRLGGDFLVSTTPLMDKQGQMIGSVHVARDITIRKQLEEKLFQSERKYRTLFETSLDGIVSVDMDGHIIECNEAYANMLGYTKDELKNLTYKHITPDKWRQMENTITTEQVLTRGYSDLYEKEHVRKDGTIFPISIRVWLMKDEYGKPVGMWGIVADITERKWMESELRHHTEHLEQIVEERTRKLKEAERMAAIGETAGMVGHDIRNPLQSIEGAVYLAKEEMKAIPSKTEPINNIEEMLDTIHEQTEYVDKIVSDLQDYARPLEPKLQETNIQLLLDSIFAEIDVPLSIDMSVKVEQDCCTIIVDPTMTKRILTNLITNAIQAMPNGGTLTIKATKKQEEVFITVQDTGVGIAEEHKPKIFKPMFTTKAKGTGFGLAAVQRLVEAHNGTVTFESQVGKGTAFTITLPTTKEAN